MTSNSAIAAGFDLGIEEAESFDAPLSDETDFVWGIAAGVLVGGLVVLFFT